MKYTVRNRYVNPPDSKAFVVEFGDPETDDMTQQQFKEDSDINHIVAKYMRGDDISRYQRHVEYVGEDFPTSMELTEAENIIARARGYFDNLPAEDRDKFDNNPQGWLDYINDPRFESEHIQKGYRIPKPQQPDQSQREIHAEPFADKAQKEAKPRKKQTESSED